VADVGVKSEYAALVREAANGDLHAMEQLLARAQESAYRFGLRVCGDSEDAEDAMQEALLKTYQHVHQIDHPGAFRTWLYATVRHACLMNRRRRAGEPAALESVEQGGANTARATIADVADPSRGVDQQLIDNWMRGRIREAIRSLPAPLRTVVLLRELEELSTKDVVALTGLSESNVKTRLHRAHLLLRQRLAHSF